MSQLPRKRPIRRVPADPLPEEPYDEYDEYEDYEYEEEPAPPPPIRSRASNVQPAAQNLGRTGGGRPANPYASLPPRGQGGGYQMRYEPPQRDIFPYILGALIGALVVGLMGVAYLLGASSRAGGGTALVGQNPGQPATDGQASGQASQPTQAAGSEPPRITLADFKALYDDPAKRPMIIDVRAAQAYDQGHIKGAISFPESDVDARIAELPKDKLVVAYCN